MERLGSVLIPAITVGGALHSSRVAARPLWVSLVYEELLLASARGEYCFRRAWCNAFCHIAAHLAVVSSTSRSSTSQRRISDW